MGNKEISLKADLKRKWFSSAFAFFRHSWEDMKLARAGRDVLGNLVVWAGQEVCLLAVQIIGMLSVRFTSPSTLGLVPCHHPSYLHCSGWIWHLEKISFKNEEPAAQRGAAGVILGVGKKAGRKQKFDLYRKFHLTREIFLYFLESASSPTLPVGVLTALQTLAVFLPKGWVFSLLEPLSPKIVAQSVVLGKA